MNRPMYLCICISICIEKCMPTTDQMAAVVPSEAWDGGILVRKEPFTLSGCEAF